MKIRIEYWQNKKTKKWHYHSFARNNKIVLPSQAFSRKALVLKAIINLPRFIASANFSILQSKDQKFYFHGKARNFEIVIPSQRYSTKQNAQRAVSRIKNAVVVSVREINK